MKLQTASSGVGQRRHLCYYDDRHCSTETQRDNESHLMALLAERIKALPAAGSTEKLPLHTCRRRTPSDHLSRFSSSLRHDSGCVPAFCSDLIDFGN